MSEQFKFENNMTWDCKFENNLFWDGKDTPENRNMIVRWLNSMDETSRESWLERDAFFREVYAAHTGGDLT